MTSSRTPVRAVIVLVVIAAVIVFDPLGALVSALPLPGADALPELPELPGWLKWVWRGLMVTAVALAVLSAITSQPKDGDSKPDGREAPE